MADRQFDRVLQHIRRLVGASRSGDPTDGQLLDRFTNQHDESAFAAIVARYGPMVLGVSRRVLQNLHDAEDAFQATFLVLARKASSLSKDRPLGNWLYTVAFHTACKAKANVLRRQKYETAVPTREASAPPDDLVLAELRAVLDEELSRLPAKYRNPLVLCYLQGKTNEAAAQQLGWTKGTVSGRLARARDVLRGRLTRRGIAISSAAGASFIEPALADAAVSSALLAATVKAASSYAAGSAAAGAISIHVSTLAHGVLRAMFISKLKIAGAALFTLTAIGIGAGNVTYHVLAMGQEGGTGPIAQKAQGNNKGKTNASAPENGIPEIVKSLQDDNPATRSQAASNLGSLGPKAQPAVLALIYALKDEDANVRQNAAAALGNIGKAAKAAVPVLLTAMRDKEVNVGLQAAWALDKIGTEGEARWRYLTTLHSFGKAGVPFLVRMLEAKQDPDSRVGIVRRLGLIGPEANAAVSALVKVLKEQTDDETHSAVIQALSQIGPDAKAAVPYLLKQLMNSEPNVNRRNDEHWRCLSALASIAPEAIDSALLEHLGKTDSDDSVKSLVAEQRLRVRILEAVKLLKMGGRTKELMPNLIGGLESNSFADRRKAADLLGMAGPVAHDAIPFLLAALEDDDAGVRGEATKALKQIDPQGARRIVSIRESKLAEIQTPQDFAFSARARRDAARKTFEARWRQYEAGERGCSSDLTLEWSRRWVEAENALNNKKPERLAAFDAHLQRTRRIEEVVRVRYEFGSEPTQDMTAAEYYRLEAEIWLAEEKLK